MTTTTTAAPTLPTDPSPLDRIVGFYQTVFTGQLDESPEHKTMVKELIEEAFTTGYTYNGKPMAPDALVAWRESLLERFPQMVFRVHDILSGPVSVKSPSPVSGVAMRWAIDTIDTAGTHWRIDGMSLLSIEGGKAASNVQLGDATDGWYRVPGANDDA